MEANLETNKENKNIDQAAIKKIDQIFRSKWFKRGAVALLAFVILILVFSLGTMVGYKKADFSFKWGDNYHKNFGGPREGFMRPVMEPAPSSMGEDFISAYGAAGLILKIDGNNLIVKGNDNTEKTILLTEKTVIRSGRQDIKIADLKEGIAVVIIGEPNDAGQIAAKLVRIFNPGINK